MTTSAAITGAVFTSTETGDRVNANLYDAKEDVYLDGGPGPNAPSSSAALDEGDYYFMVTDPSGKDLLSTDPIACRGFHVGEDGFITAVTPAGGCEHATGIDEDYGDDGAITVQLMPYLDTTNEGGEYKVWIILQDDYDATKGKHGFRPRYSKTDNFKVRESEPEPEPCCGDGVKEGDEECDDGNTADGDGCSAECTIEPPPCCGDGVREGDEECDDGNTADGDGCSAQCTIEPSGCCGNGVVEAGEACDDGNTSDGDTCSSDCQYAYPPQ
jgi:cysteine-rich repeat protein